ncbi:hypothetical protein BC940DRAFT_316522 [Gongronella butleri]|nr:hypothetical protein BC940DRAFT_316522 [Gongronella butleri]
MDRQQQDHDETIAAAHALLTLYHRACAGVRVDHQMSEVPGSSHSGSNEDDDDDDGAWDVDDQGTNASDTTTDDDQALVASASPPPLHRPTLTPSSARSEGKRSSRLTRDKKNTKKQHNEAKGTRHAKRNNESSVESGHDSGAALSDDDMDADSERDVDEDDETMKEDEEMEQSEELEALDDDEEDDDEEDDDEEMSEAGDTTVARRRKMKAHAHGKATGRASSVNVSQGISKPRWSDHERKLLVLALIKEKQLDKIDTFPWQTVAKRLRKPTAANACRHQWRHHLLPKMTSFYQSRRHKKK